MAELNYRVDCAVVVLIASFLVIISQAASSRVLPGDFPQQNGGVPSGFRLLDVNHPCWYEKSAKKLESETRIREKIGSKYELLILNFLPKGTPVPPSGPSQGGNNIAD